MQATEPGPSPGSLISRALMRLAAVAPASKKALWRWVYEALSNRGGLGDFMNFGYMAGPGEALHLDLEGKDAERRYVIQLYHRTIAAAEVSGKDVLEVGCGRGGGASYISRKLAPRSVTGIDISPGNIEFCRGVHEQSNLRFAVGDAENLPLPNASVDVVVNLESSHCYPSFERFVSEVARVLRPGGAFMFSDMRGTDSHQASLDEVERTFAASSLAVVEHADITSNVLRALDHESRRIDEFLAGMPKLLAGPTRDLVGGKGGRWYDALVSGDAKYVHYHLRKAS